jgi:DnaD/phage-associated family protein
MKGEAGEDAKPVVIEDEFFKRILPDLRDLAELKLALHARYLAAHLGTPAIPVAMFMSPEVVRSVAGTHSPEPGVDRVRRAIDRAVANGVLLRLTVESTQGTGIFVLPATPQNRQLVERAVHDAAVAEALGLPSDFEASLYRPNIYAVYERHIGPLTPLVAEQLREAERSYPRTWVEQAILEAAQYKRRSWRYIEAILSQWEERGAPPEAPRIPL